jgi:hypothetical protein
LFFGNAKNSNKGMNSSYSIMGRPCCNKCKIEANCTTFFAFFLTIPFATWATTLSLPHLTNNFLVFAMPTIFGEKPICFFHISPNILISFLLTYMFTKRISFKNKQLIFPCGGGIVKDNRWIQANKFTIEDHILKTKNLM